MQQPLSGYLQPVLPLIFSFLLNPAIAAERYPTGPLHPDRFNRLAMAVRNADPTIRVDFAVLAVSEMVLAHRNEADRARQDARTNVARRNPTRWARAVDAYAADLTAVVNSVTTDTAVRIEMGPENSVALHIDGKPVMVSVPTPQQQAVLEQRVIDRFCDLHRCEELIAEHQQTRQLPRIEHSTLLWRFSEQAGPACATDDGLEFQFRDRVNLSRKRQACSQIVAELNTLADLIAENLAAGVRIDWNRLAIRPYWEADQHLVELDSRGGAVRVSLPTLAVTPQLLPLIRPWLAAKVKGNSDRQVVIDADRLMAPLLQTRR